MTCTFTKELLEEKINTGEHQVFAYPAGSGKTTAICEYIVDQIQSRKIDRKIIYVAPTKSLLNNLYDKLITAGLDKSIIFNYHSSSEDYKECCKQNYLERINIKIQTALVILITHERMKFEVVDRFINIVDIRMSKAKPLVFLDESVEDCNIAILRTKDVIEILFRSSLIDKDEDHHDFLVKKDRLPMMDAKKIQAYITRACEYNSKIQAKTICHLDALGIKLANPVGFSEEADLTVPEIRAKFLELYAIISMAIAEGKWLEFNNQCYIKIPLAIHESWRNYAQIIIMDATAFINACFCEGFNFNVSSSWNSELLTNYVESSDLNTKTRLLKTPEAMIDFLNEIDLRKYNKIYITTFKQKLLSRVNQYLIENYPDYKVEYFETKEIEHYLKTDIDTTTDEGFSTSTQIEKIIYLANFGQTRGSNKFRDCECVIQLGTYRINPDFLQCLKQVYPNVTSNKLALVNYLQELYRGRIRCNKEMVSYSLIDQEFFNYMTEELKTLGFKFDIFNSKTGFSPYHQKDFFNRYGINKDLVMYLYHCKIYQEPLTRKGVTEACHIQRWIKAKERLLNLYCKQKDLRTTVFERFDSLEKLEEALTSEVKNRFAKELNILL